ncbi:MAG: AzlD domain-containing protein [Spirochaetales bacterium]|jgi:branched-subunit amino acid transport protein AzlD|nr:AzlD domain-containing protein [Spirochaetales bacterium]
MSWFQAAVLVAIMAVCTFLTRALPFLFFPSGKRIPPFITWLGKTLPFPLIGMLIVYCLKDLTPAASPYGLPEFLAAAVVCALYLAKRNSLIAIAGGTIVYMILVQRVFNPG